MPATVSSVLARARSLQIVDPIATTFARHYQSQTDGYIGRRLFPEMPVTVLSGQYPIFDEQVWFADDIDIKVSDRDPAKEIDFAWSTDSYLCESYALKVSWTDLEESQAENAIRFRQQKSELLSLRMLLAKERRIATVLRESGVSGGQLDSGATATPGTNWDTSSVIESDIASAAQAMYQGIGISPNVIVIPWLVAYAMAINSNFRTNLRYDAAGRERDFIQLGDQVLPSVIHGMQVMIPKGAQTTATAESATPGASTVTKTEIWGDEVRLLYVDPNAAWGMPTVGYNIVHTPLTATRWRETDPDVNYQRQLERVDEKVVAPKAGYVLVDVLS